MAGISKMLIAGATLVAGAVAAMFLMKKLPPTVTSKLVVAGKNLSPVLVPIAGGIGLAVLATKVKGLKPHADKLHLASLGMVTFGLLSALDVYGVKQKLGIAGYVPSMRGYVPSMRGYVPSANLGQVGPGRSIVPLSSPRLASGGRPYGTGAPKDQRSYNKFSWAGVYDGSNYE